MKFEEEFLEKLKEAESILFFTGAGISAESGVPTFRGKDGIWNKLKPEELANFDAFLRNPDLVWEWYQHRKKIVNETIPNPGHKAISEFENYYDEVVVSTQNVDNLHNRAGSSNVYELHGNIVRNYCVDCKTYYDESELGDSEGVPKCKHCGGLIRPDVVWFGEFLPQDHFRSSERAAEQCDICFVVGTSAVVYPAAYIPVTARSSGAYIVEVNIESTEMSRYSDYSLFGKAGEVLPKVLEQVKNLKSPKSSYE
jgi:NAD-dependent deacetylase